MSTERKASQQISSKEIYRLQESKQEEFKRIPTGYQGPAEWRTRRGNIPVLIKRYWHKKDDLDTRPHVSVELAIPGQGVFRVEGSILARRFVAKISDINGFKERKRSEEIQRQRMAH